MMFVGPEIVFKALLNVLGKAQRWQETLSTFSQLASSDVIGHLDGLDRLFYMVFVALHEATTARCQLWLMVITGKEPCSSSRS